MTVTSNFRIRSKDMPTIDRVFGMEGGYVLDFSNRTFAEFFREEIGVDIDDPRWAVEGGSKAKRLRYYLRQANRQTALDTLNALWGYREASSVTAQYRELNDSVRAAYFRIIQRLGADHRNRRCRSPCVENYVSMRPKPLSSHTLSQGFHHGAASPWLCLREVPEGRI